MMNDDNETCMMNIDANVDDLKDYVGTSIYILKSRNPPIPSRHVSNLTMSNFDAYKARIEEISTLAPFTAHYVGSVHDIYDGCIGSSMKFQDSSDNDSIEGNDE
jgi:hypothetical protein